jgi:hypothetical protein
MVFGVASLTIPQVLKRFGLRTQNADVGIQVQCVEQDLNLPSREAGALQALGLTDAQPTRFQDDTSAL